MTSVKISQLPASPTISGVDLIPMVNTSSTETATGRTQKYTRWQDFNFVLTGMGLITLPACLCASTENLIVSYDNGLSGVGATITAVDVGVLELDGLTPAVGSAVLIKDQTTKLQNGIYIVTNTGSNDTVFILTRASYYDTTAEIKDGDAVLILSGDTYTGLAFTQDTPGIIFVGVTPIVFTAFSVVLAVDGTPHRITATTISSLATIDIAADYVGQASITTLGTVTEGIWASTIISPQFGGTGLNNNALTINLLNGEEGLVLTSDSLGNAAWIDLPPGVDSIDGTPDRITVSEHTGDIIIDIALTYVGQTSITTLGTITTGQWNASLIPLAYGGTNALLLASQGGIFYSTATEGAILSGTATARQILLSGAHAAPEWSTATYPVTTTANQLLYSQSNNSIAGLATAVNSVLITDGSGIPSISQTLPLAVQLNITETGAVTTGVWEGTPVGLLYGGTNAALTASNGGIFYSTASAGAILSGTATVNQVLLSGANTAPSWSSAVYPPTTTANELLYSVSGNVITGLATANNSVLITSSGGVPSFSTTLPLAVQLNITETGTITTGVWQGTPIGLLYGGTNAALTASNGGIFYSTASAGAILSGTATASQVLLSGSNAAPSWSIATYPSTTTINQLLYSSATNTITGLATANNSVLITSGAGAPSLSQTLPSAVQLNITSLGTVTTGVWHATPIDGTFINYNTTNLKVTANQLNTIQDISTISSPTFLNVTASSKITCNAFQLVTPFVLNFVLRADNVGNASWQDLHGFAVTSAVGTANRITVTPTVGDIVIDISGSYVGQTSIITLGTLTTGTWHATAIDGTFINYNTTNLKVTTNQLNTIQDIATSSSPTFANVVATTNIKCATFQMTTSPTVDYVLTSDASGNGTWRDLAGISVTSVTGTTNRITATPTTGDVVVDIAAAYVGQTSITTLGTIATGIWHGTVVAGQYGGTGVANTGLTITLASGAVGKVLTSDSSGNGTWATIAASGVTSISGTSNQINMSASTGSVTASLSSTIITPGTLTVSSTLTLNSGFNNGSILLTDGSHNVIQTSLLSFDLANDDLIVGNPSPIPGATGPGAINCQSGIYLNGLLYNFPQWTFKHYFNNGVVDKHGKFAPPFEYDGVLPLESHREYVRENWDLPLILKLNSNELFSNSAMVLASLEEAYIYIYQLHDRIMLLESKFQ